MITFPGTAAEDSACAWKFLLVFSLELFLDSFLLLQAFDPAGVSAISGLCIFVVVDADEQDFACIFPDRFGVLLSADLIDGALRGAVPLEFYYQRRPA